MIGYVSGSDEVIIFSVFFFYFSDSFFFQFLVYGFLGRVRVMKLMFEVECQKFTEIKIFRFFFRKFSFVDSIFSFKCFYFEVVLKRYFLGDDSVLF